MKHNHNHNHNYSHNHNHDYLSGALSVLFLLLLPFTVKSQSGIGVNTTTPLSTLDVNGSFASKVTTITATTTLDDTYSFVICNNAALITVTLPLASGAAGRIYTLKKINTGNVSVSRTPPNSIEGSNTPWLIEDAYEVVKFVSDGSNWNIMGQVTPVPKGAGTGGAWNQGGNGLTSVKTLGTTTNYDLPFITNNTERMRIGATGDVAIGTTAFDGTYPEQLLVDAGTTTSVNAIAGKGTINSYLQLNIQNKSTGTAASSDIVATANNGSELVNYVDLGINGGGNTSTGIIGGANSAYLYSLANDFSIGNATAAKNLLFFTGGTTSANERMRIDGTGNIGMATTAPNSTVDIKGSLAINYRAVTATTALLATDNTVIFTGSSTATLTLPTAVTCLGRMYTIKNASTTLPTPVLNIATTSSQTIDGSSSTSIAYAGNTLTLISDGANWRAFTSNSQPFTGATGVAAGIQGLVPAPAAGDQNKFLAGSGSWTSSIPFIIANGTYSSTTEVRDYNTWVSRGTGFYITDVAAPIGNGIPNEGAWFTYSQVGVNGGYFGQTTLNDHDFYFRGDAVGNLATSVWYRMLRVPATSRMLVAVDGSNNVTLNNVDNGFMAFSTNNTEKMRIATNGDVAIGATTFDGTYPEQLLVDAGTTTSVNAICGKGSINSYLQLNIQNRSTGTAASSDLVATANNGSELVNYVDLGINGGGNTSTGVIGGLNNGYLYSMANDFSIGNATAARNLIFFTGGLASANERMRIDGNGNVGIGTTIFDATYPEQLVVDAGTTTSVNAICGKGTINSYLQLNIQNKSAGTSASSDLVATADNGSETANYVDLGINSSANTSTGVIGGANNVYLYSQANDFSIGNAAAAKNLIFFTGGTAVANERMRIDGTGDVGIGTTNPTNTLHVRGTYTGYTSGVKFENVTGSAVLNIIPGVGVGGTAASTSALYEISGSGFHVFSDHVIPDGNNTWDLGTTANRWRDVWCSRGAFNGSDRRMKKNITPLDYGLNELLKINTYSYNWIEAKMDDGYRYLGVIAQELKEIMPELIRESNEGDKLMSVNYTGLIPVLINAVKQQQQLIDQLTTQNASLQDQSKDVKKELDNLKAELKTISEFVKSIPVSQVQQ